MKRLAVILILLLGFISVNGQIQLTLPTISGAPNSEKIVDIVVTDLTLYNVQGYQFELLFDPLVVTFSAPPNQDGTITKNATITSEANIIPGRIAISAISSTTYKGSGVLFRLKAKLIGVGSTSITLNSTFNNHFLNSSLQEDKTFTLVAGRATVSTTNNPPVFDPITDKTVKENVELAFTVNAVDPEGNTLTYGIQNAPSGSTFTNKEFKWKPSFQQSGTHTVTFTANDGTSTASINVKITVEDVNTAPTITPVNDKTINEGVELNIDIVATDAEGDNLTYSATNKPAGSTFDETLHKFNWKPSSTQSGNYSVTFSVSDGKVSSSITVKITVVDVNGAPIITPIADKTVNTNKLLSFEITATDPDGDALTYGTSSLPTGAKFDATTHKFEWTPTNLQAGNFQITFFVSDGKVTTQIVVNITVVRVNSAPKFTKWMKDTTISVHNVPIEFKYQYVVSDEDGDQLTFKLDQAPDGATISATGLFKWTPKVSDAGKNFLIMVTVSDGLLGDTKFATLTTNANIVGVDDLIMPDRITLSQNYPNPFNPATTIKFGLPKEGYVSLKVFNLLGEEVATILNEQMSTGFHSVSFDASKLPSGMYIYRISSSNYMEMKKMILMK